MTNMTQLEKNEAHRLPTISTVVPRRGSTLARAIAATSDMPEARRETPTRRWTAVGGKTRTDRPTASSKMNATRAPGNQSVSNG